MYVVAVVFSAAVVKQLLIIFPKSYCLLIPISQLVLLLLPAVSNSFAILPLELLPAVSYFISELYLAIANFISVEIAHRGF